ncbi:hypothetical protein [Nocardioides sp. SR21]|uniref:hypothetical protein n=1 Tax=Nocardioides sp. SR21 TaxID=2919501 RepID=UPI001FAA11B2|nr:hypothetical protein [Nocardioides sp. SR21]
MSTSQQSLITVVVDGRTLGTFDTFSGGEPSSDPQKHRPGGMQQEKSYGALVTYGDVTVGRVLERERDIELYRSLLPRYGRALVTVTKQPIDDNGAPWGRPFTYTGRLSSATDPESDSNDATPSVWQLTMICTGRA